jgi:hypothetical protein
MSVAYPSVRTFLRNFTVTCSCLLLAGVLAIAPASAACGNGVVEAGEDCDDGSSQNGGANSCCTSACTFSGEVPDVIVGDLSDTQRYGQVNGITAYAIGTTSCNLGSCWLNWISGTADHPVIGQNMYRLKDGRFEQLGQSWLKHGFTALTGSVCSASCVHPPNGSHLGVNCSDPYVASLNGTQTSLGPKQDVDPSSGVFPYPDARINSSGDAIFKRLQVHNTDLDPTQNVGAIYFAEGQYVTKDDASAKNNGNNASYRPLSVTSAGGNPPVYNIALTGTTQRQKAGIKAWKDTDPTVTETLVGAPGGQFIVSSKATSLGGGVYHYEYAVQNLNNQRAAQKFTVPLPAGTIVTNVGFHDVDYHSGEPFVGTDWTPTVAATSVSWACETFATNANANALRWGTLYNFRFDANVAPGMGNATFDMFKPGSPTTATGLIVTPNLCFGAANGAACTDGNPCTTGDSCQSSVCSAGTPVVCVASDACHSAGTCDSGTGICSNPSAPNGTSCSDGNLCTQSDSCQSGVCTGSNPVVCTASDACHAAGTCAVGTGVCSNPTRPNGTGCNDGNLCTQVDTCQSGVCTGASPVSCTASNQCHDIGTCVPATGTCTNPSKPDGSPCSDGNACTQTDTCTTGSCGGSNPVICSALDACHTAGVCNPSNGACSNPNAPDGSPCSDNDACTQTDGCQSGTCAGSNSVVCTASDICHDVGICAPATGVCSNPQRANGSACDDANDCTTDDACADGVCTGSGTPLPSEVDSNVHVAQISGVTTISWNVPLGAMSSSVLRGLVTGLPVGPGGGEEVCLATDIAGSSTTDPETPDPDTGYWYLVRAANPCGKGPYGSQVENGVATPRVSQTCP